MDIQTILAGVIVLVCAIVLLRSWIAFWVRLIRPASNDSPGKSACSGCAGGCIKDTSSVQIVEIKRISVR